MDQELKSEGKCLFCNQSFSQKEIGKHLASHFVKMEKEDSNNKPEMYCHILVEADAMFLHLLVKGNATMENIDLFLREIWLECCGHMSEFNHKDIKIPMTRKVEDVLANKEKISHDYDFGDTTTVWLKGIKNYKLKLKDSIVLLSRNEPLKLVCAKCSKGPAISICVACQWDFYCKSCASKHKKECADFDDYANMPIVNSPRLGVCGYMGGSIDLERDGVYKKH